jgi:hypothetical protein
MRGRLKIAADCAAGKKQKKARPVFRLGPLPLGQFDCPVRRVTKKEPTPPTEDHGRNAP